MSLIRESLKKVQEENQNDKTTATLISASKAEKGKKDTIRTVVLVGIGVVLVAGAYLFLYRTGPPRSAAPAGATAPKPLVVAQAASPATPGKPGGGPSLTVPEPTQKAESKAALKGPVSATGTLSSSMAPPSSQGRSSREPLKEKLVEASVLGPGPASAEKSGRGKEGLGELTLQLKEKTRQGPRPKGATREGPAAVRTGVAGEPQDTGAQEGLKQSYQQAYSWQQEGKTEQAMSRYREILNQDPYNPYVLTNLGLIFQQKGNWKEAISLYEKALESDPKFVPAAQNLGVAWLKVGNSEEAARWLERTLALQPDNANALVNLGILYKRRGNLEMARQSLRKAWRLNNRLPEASYNLARLEEEAGNIPEAYTYYQEFIRTRNDPNDGLVREVQRHIQPWRIPEQLQK